MLNVFPLYLQKKGLSPEELQHQRNQLLNQHQLELSSLDKKLFAEEQDIEKGALADWEVEYAKAKLNMKEKHYRVNINVCFEEKKRKIIHLYITSVLEYKQIKI
jgi:hypothetical protein